MSFDFPEYEFPAGQGVSEMLVEMRDYFATATPNPISPLTASFTSATLSCLDDDDKCGMNLIKAPEVDDVQMDFGGSLKLSFGGGLQSQFTFKYPVVPEKPRAFTEGDDMLDLDKEYDEVYNFLVEDSIAPPETPIVVDASNHVHHATASDFDADLDSDEDSDEEDSDDEVMVDVVVPPPTPRVVAPLPKKRARRHCGGKFPSAPPATSVPKKVAVSSCSTTPASPPRSSVKRKAATRSPKKSVKKVAFAEASSPDSPTPLIVATTPKKVTKKAADMAAQPKKSVKKPAVFGTSLTESSLPLVSTTTHEPPVLATCVSLAESVKNESSPEPAGGRVPKPRKAYRRGGAPRARDVAWVSTTSPGDSTTTKTRILVKNPRARAPASRDGERTHECPHCTSFACFAEGDLQRHLETHKEPSFTCFGCFFVYTRLDALTRHHRSVTGRVCKAPHARAMAEHGGES